MLSDLGVRWRTQISAQPFSELRLGPSAARDCEHRSLSITHRGPRVPSPPIELDKHPQRHPGGPFIPVWEWVILSQTDCEDCTLVDEVRLVVGVREAGLRRVDGGIGEFGP